MNNNESVVLNGVSTLIRNNVLSPLVNYLATKNCQVTVDELATVLKLAPTTITPPSMMNTSIPSLNAPNMNMGLNMAFPAPLGYPSVNAPPTLTGFGGMPLPVSGSGNGGGKGRGKATASAENIPESERCQYIFTRGRNVKQRCPSRAELQTPFCNQCKGKKSAASQLNSGGPSVNTGLPFPGIGGLPGISAMPGLQAPSMGMLPGSFASTGTLNQLNPAVTSALSAPAELPKIQVVQLGQGVYHEKNYNLLIKSSNNGYICCGIYDPMTNSALPLTADKIEICKQLKMNYVDPSASTNSAPSVSGQTLPSINQQLPGISALPTPQVNMTLPSVNTQQFGLPQVPSLSGINTFAGVASVTDYRSPDDPNGDDDEDEDDDE